MNDAWDILPNARRCLSVIGIATLALLADTGTPLHAQSARDTMIELRQTRVVDITVFSGAVVIRGVDGNTGTVRGLRGNQQVRSTGVTLTVEGRTGDGRVERSDRDRRLSRSNPQGRDTLEIEVPRDVHVVINSRSGDIDVQGVTGGLDVHSLNGSHLIRAVRGRIVAESISGDITISDSPTPVRVTSVSGEIDIRGVRDDVSVHTVSGDVRISDAALSRLMVDAVSADVTIDATFAADAHLQINTHSGDIVLRTPGIPLGRLDVSTVSGTLNAGFPMTLIPSDLTRTTRDRSVRQYQLGTGGTARLEITTFNGDITILRDRHP